MDRLLFDDARLRLDVIVPGQVTRKIRAYGSSLMMVEVFFETGSEGAAHEHPHEQASYCLEGEFEFYIGDNSFRLSRGDSIVIPGGRRHGTKCLEKGRLLDAFSPPREDFLAHT
jgi:quercetin dioxygenase-like cupin family protein